MNNSGVLIGGVVVVLLALGAWWYFSHQPATTNQEGGAAVMQNTDSASDTAAVANANMQSRDNSDASLSQDMASINTQMDQFSADQSAAASAQ